MGAVEFFSIVVPAAFWPLAVVLIAWWQRRAISGLIHRIRGGRVFGQEFDASPPEELEDAVEGGTSSPEVQRIVADELAFSRPVQARDGENEEAQGAEVEYWIARVRQSEAHQADLLARLAEAQLNDEQRRREEIERVMVSAARWGARIHDLTDVPPGDLEPEISWLATGEPSIVARVRGEDARLATEVSRSRAKIQEAREHLKDAETGLKAFDANPPADITEGSRRHRRAVLRRRVSDASAAVDDARMEHDRARHFANVRHPLIEE